MKIPDWAYALGLFDLIRILSSPKLPVGGIEYDTTYAQYYSESGYPEPFHSAPKANVNSKVLFYIQGMWVDLDGNEIKDGIPTGNHILRM